MDNLANVSRMEIKNEYKAAAVIGNHVFVTDNPDKLNGRFGYLESTFLENVKLERVDGELRVSGRELISNFILEDTPVSDFKDEIREEFIYDQKNWFSGTIKKYVSAGWFLFKETKPFKRIFSNYIIDILD